MDNIEGKIITDVRNFSQEASEMFSRSIEVYDVTYILKLGDDSLIDSVTPISIKERTIAVGTTNRDVVHL